MAPDPILPRSSRPVFRAEAVKQYVRSREEVILPRYVSRRSIALLWCAVAAIIAGTVALLMVRLPLYTSGTALSPQAGGSLEVSVPAGAAAHVRPGQPTYIYDPGGARRFAGRVDSVGGGGAGPSAPAGEAVVRVRLAAAAAACRSRTCRVDIRIGSPRALAFFAPGDLRTGN